MPWFRIAVLAFGGLCAWAQDGSAVPASASSATPSALQPWTIADLDGDNQADLVVATIEQRNGALRIATPILAESFEDVGQPTPYLSPYILTVRDFDEDDDPDVVLLDAFTRRELSWWANDGEGGLEPGDPALLAAKGNRKRQWLGQDDHTQDPLLWAPTQNAAANSQAACGWSLPGADVFAGLHCRALFRALFLVCPRGPPASSQL
jgi:hypothetical protein